MAKKILEAKKFKSHPSELLCAHILLKTRGEDRLIRIRALIKFNFVFSSSNMIFHPLRRKTISCLNWIGFFPFGAFNKFIYFLIKQKSSQFMAFYRVLFVFHFCRAKGRINLVTAFAGLNLAIKTLRRQSSWQRVEKTFLEAKFLRRFRESFQKAFQQYSELELKSFERTFRKFVEDLFLDENKFKKLRDFIRRPSINSFLQISGA